MKKQEFKIEITETLQKTIVVDATTIDEAITIVKNMYRNEEIILDSSDYIDKEFDERT